jgi:hypothetical protein
MRVSFCYSRGNKRVRWRGGKVQQKTRGLRRGGRTGFSFFAAGQWSITAMSRCNTCRPLLILLSTVAELGGDFTEAGFTGLFFS